MRPTTTHSPAAGRRAGLVPAGLVPAVCLALVSISLVAPPSGRAMPTEPQATMQLEAENFLASSNAGGNAIQVVSCSGARGGYAVDGMDWPGDYIEWNLTLAQSLVFRDSLRSAGAIGLVRQFAVLFLPSGGGSPVAADTLTTPPGLGIG